MQLADGIASWIVRTSIADIPADALAAAELSCFDCLGVALLGRATPVGARLVAYAGDHGGHPHCTIVGDANRTAPAMAALVNGALAHAMDFDAAGGFGHPAAVLFAALLALGERRRVTGRALLEAYVIGCEVGLALYYNGGGAKHAYRQMETGFHATSVFGRMAAAAACAKLLGLDERGVAAALGIAASGASGLVANFGTMTKPLHAGFAARDGVMAAELAARGVTSRLEAPDRALGFTRSYFGAHAAAAELVVARLQRVFLSPFVYSIKRAPTCGFNSSVTESLSTLVREGRFTAADVDRIEIAMPDPDSEVLLYAAPQTALEAKFSVRFNAAVAVLQRERVLFAHSDEAVRDPDIVDLMTRIQVRLDSSPAAVARPSGDAVPVRVRLRSGGTIERATPPADVEGAATRPLAPEQVAAKFCSNAEAVFGRERCQVLLETWRDLRTIPDISVAAALAAT